MVATDARVVQYQVVRFRATDIEGRASELEDLSLFRRIGYDESGHLEALVLQEADSVVRFPFDAERYVNNSNLRFPYFLHRREILLAVSVCRVVDFLFRRWVLLGKKVNENAVAGDDPSKCGADGPLISMQVQRAAASRVEMSEDDPGFFVSVYVNLPYTSP